MRKIADSVDALLMMDMAHISGLVAAGVVANPFAFCDIVTTTTHKTLRGPRSGMIFFKRDKKLNLEDRINFAVFPSTQGGPHNNTIAAVAVQLKEVATPEFKAYAQQVVANCRAMAARLVEKGHSLASGGSDNHLLLWNLRPHNITGNKYELLCDKVSITVNKNSIHGDKSALAPGGVRVGSPALTTRGFKEKDFVRVADFLDRAVQLAVTISKAQAGPKLADYEIALNSEAFAAPIAALRDDVEAFAKTFPMPGFDVSKLQAQQ
jgi:glycine hydroxymethyltransferase